MELLEHVPDPASVIHASAQLLAPVAWFLFHHQSQSQSVGTLTIGAAEYLLKWIPKARISMTPSKPSELSAMARQSGLEVVGLAGWVISP